MEITIKDENGCLFIDTVHVDSLNPIAAFDVTSPEFLDPAVCEGTEDLSATFINNSQNYHDATNPLSEIIFKWNLYANEPVNGPANWFFKYNESNVDTVYKANATELYTVGLVAFQL